MRRFLRRLFTSSNVIAIVALVVAMGGLAVAAIPSASGTIIGCYAKHGGALRLVSSAHRCHAKEKVIRWSQTGPAGAAGTARAYGFIHNDATLDAHRRKNITGVTHPATGVYCVQVATAIDVSHTVAALTPDYGDSSADDWHAATDIDDTSCPSNSVRVVTYHGSFTLTDDVAFSIVVP